MLLTKCLQILREDLLARLVYTKVHCHDVMSCDITSICLVMSCDITFICLVKSCDFAPSSRDQMSQYKDDSIVTEQLKNLGN